MNIKIWCLSELLRIRRMFVVPGSWQLSLQPTGDDAMPVAWFFPTILTAIIFLGLFLDLLLDLSITTTEMVIRQVVLLKY